jgi:HK97 family phage major capsid protein
MGMGIVGTPAMPDNDFLVGAFRDGATMYDREEANVMVATENEDDFIRNLATALCEERVALEVRRPQAFVYGTFQAGSGT